MKHQSASLPFTTASVAEKNDDTQARQRNENCKQNQKSYYSNFIYLVLLNFNEKKFKLYFYPINPVGKHIC